MGRPPSNVGLKRARPAPADLLGRRVPGTGWPAWLLLGLITLGLPRTILTDLGIVEPNDSAAYFALALVPFAVWFVVAVFRKTATPIRDHLVAGTLYGLSLIIVHEVLWNAGASLGHEPPQTAVSLADQFGTPLRGVVLHGATSLIAMMIGLGVGGTAAVVAALSNRVARGVLRGRGTSGDRP